MYRTYSYRDMPVLKEHRQEQAQESRPEKPRDTKAVKGDTKTKKRDAKTLPILGDLTSDEIIIIAVAIILLADGCDDMLLIAALAFLFLSDRL